MRSHCLIIIALAATLVACRDDNKKTVDGSVDAQPSYTIQQVQSDAVAPGTPVVLTGVVVTAIDTYGAKTGDIWVEEPEGGPFSGIHIFKADPAVVMTLALGDIVTVTNAQKSSFALSTDTTGRTETELEPPMGQMVTVTKTGTGSVPAPAVVDALTIGQMTDVNNNGDRSAAWRMWDGVLITVNSVAQTSSIAQIGGTTPDPTLKKFNITGVALVESSLSAFPTTGLGFNQCLGSVTGVLSYFFDYQILPRTTAEIVTGGTGCPAAEAGAQCSNTIDDDANGFSDCNDNNCVIDQGSCRATTTIGAIDAAADANPTMPTLPAGMPVGVEIGNGTTTDVYVSAIAANGKDFWVSETLTAASDKGLYVFSGGQTFVATGDVGKTVHLIGTLKAFNNDTQGESLIEFQALAVQNISSTAVTPIASNCGSATNLCSATVLTTAATGRPYVGSLVTLKNVKVVTPSDPANHNNAALTQTPSGGSATPFEAMGDATLIPMTTYPAGTCFATFTGIWTYDVYNNKYAIEPTTLGATTGGTCP